MSFLLRDDYDSNSGESESDAEETVTSQRTDGESKTREDVPAQLLPSADSVLSSVSASTASFLPPKSSTKAQSTVKSFDLSEEHEEQRQEKEKEGREQKEAKRVAEIRSTTSSRNERKRHTPPEVATRDQSTKREKKDAKERVKNQRVKGQAGIGSDFRAWKSETEMALRQQFD